MFYTCHRNVCVLEAEWLQHYSCTIRWLLLDRKWTKIFFLVIRIVYTCNLKEYLSSPCRPQPSIVFMPFSFSSVRQPSLILSSCLYCPSVCLSHSRAPCTTSHLRHNSTFIILIPEHLSPCTTPHTTNFSPAQTPIFVTSFEKDLMY